MRLALDAMGGDLAPAAAIQGGLLFAEEFPEDEIVLVGDSSALSSQLPRPWPENVRVRHAAEVVGMDEHAGAAIRRKRDSSLRVCFDLVASGEAQGMVSAGHSGAVMAGALLVLGRIRHVERPAFAALFPALKGDSGCLLIDAGANTECTPRMLAQFGVMGEAYVRRLLSVTRPRVSVLSNGEEETKGTALTREAAALLRAGKEDLDFRGYVEGKDIFSGEVDVVVTDGFTGNVVLKTVEGTAMGVAGLLRSAVGRAGLSEKLGALLLKPTLAGLKKVVDYAEYGGAPLLGVRGVSIVAHGRSNPKAIKNALKAARRTVAADLIGDLTRRIARAEAWLPAKRRGKEATDEGV